MARGRGGIRTARQHAALTRGERRRFEEVHEPASRLRLRGEARSDTAALRQILGRDPAGREVGQFHDLAGRGPRDWQRLYRGDEPMPAITPDGIYDTVNPTWRQRSAIGRQWSLIGRTKRMSDEQLATELRRFRGIHVRVIDPETGRVVHMPLETDPARFRSFAESSEARQERVISPRLGPEGR
jgi:hypothetical protein